MTDYSRKSRYAIAALAAIFLLPGGSLSIAATEPENPSAPATQPATVSQHDLQLWITELAGDDAQTRRDALGKLMDLKARQLPALRAAALSQRSLLPEQIAALRQAVTQVFLAGQPFDYATDPNQDFGFLGLQWTEDAPPPPPDGVLVWSRIPGCIAYRMFEQGDIIVKIIRQPALPDIEVHQVQQFTDPVKQMHAGDILRLQILRYGRPMDISIRLGHRPLYLEQDVNGIKRQQWLNARAQSAEDYWNHEFSAIDPAAAPVQATSSTQP